MTSLYELAQGAAAGSLDGLAKEFGGLILQDLRPVLDGAEEDLRSFGLRLGALASVAALTGDKALEAQVRGQVRMIGELQRVRLRGVEWDVAERVVGMVIKGGVAALGGAIAAAK